MRKLIILAVALFAALSLTACSGGSSDGSLDVEKPGSSRPADGKNIEIPIGAPESRVTKLLGTPDMTDTDVDGRTIWMFMNKTAGYVYVSNSTNIPVLEIGDYMSEGESAMPVMLTVIISKGKVVDFNFAQVTF